jgi:hypothetical protein
MTSQYLEFESKIHYKPVILLVMDDIFIHDAQLLNFSQLYTGGQVSSVNGLSTRIQYLRSKLYDEALYRE